MTPNQPKTPTRTFRAPDSEWDPAKAHAAEVGETLTDVLRRALREYPTEKAEDGDE